MNVGKPWIDSSDRKISSCSTSSSSNTVANNSSKSMDPKTTTDPLCSQDYSENPLFSRFWKTQTVARDWIRNYQNCVRESPSRLTSPTTLIPPPPPPPPPIPPILLSRALVHRRRSSKKRKISHHRDEEKVDFEAPSSSTNKVMESMEEEWEGIVAISAANLLEDVIEDDVEEENLELSEDVLSFMAQTIRHRIEREKKKEYERELEERTVVYVPADRPFMASRFNEFGGDASAVARMLLSSTPSATNDESKLSMAERKRQEMIDLYGSEAAERIQIEETLLQMKFDQEYDQSHPPFWPNIPFKL